LSGLNTCAPSKVLWVNGPVPPIKKPTVRFERFAGVQVPFPFTERNATKNRPARGLSSPDTFNSLIGHSVMAMITSESNPPWPLDKQAMPERDAKALDFRAASQWFGQLALGALTAAARSQTLALDCGRSVQRLQPAVDARQQWSIPDSGSSNAQQDRLLYLGHCR